MPRKIENSLFGKVLAGRINQMRKPSAMGEPSANVSGMPSGGGKLFRRKFGSRREGLFKSMMPKNSGY